MSRCRYPLCLGVPGLENLRSKRCFRVIERAFYASNKNKSFRLIHFSVQSNHLHLVVEASHAQALSRGMQGLTIRIARGLNRLLGRKGRVFSTRFYARTLKTPREVNACLHYVLNNTRRHHRHTYFSRGWIDPCSSGKYFSGWRDRNEPLPPQHRWPVALPQSWLLKTGWEKWGPLEIDKRPGPSALVPY